MSTKLMMNTKLVLTVSLWALCLMPSYAQGKAEHKASTTYKAVTSGKKSLEVLKKAVLHDQIEHCEVFYLPDYIESAAALEPGQVEHFYEYRFGFGLLSSHSKEMISLCNALDKTKVGTPTPYGGDYRWGCIFYNGERQRRCSIFVDDTGTSAVINGRAVSLKGGFYLWLKSNFLPRFVSF